MQTYHVGFNGEQIHRLYSMRRLLEIVFSDMIQFSMCSRKEMVQCIDGSNILSDRHEVLV